jgi:hypothetical protein
MTTTVDTGRQDSQALRRPACLRGPAGLMRSSSIQSHARSWHIEMCPRWPLESRARKLNGNAQPPET